MPKIDLQGVVERAIREADERYPILTDITDGGTEYLTHESYNDEGLRFNQKAEYVIAEIRREVLRDPGLLAGLGIHREDMV